MWCLAQAGVLELEVEQPLLEPLDVRLVAGLDARHLVARALLDLGGVVVTNMNGGQHR